MAWSLTAADTGVPAAAPRGERPPRPALRAACCPSAERSPPWSSARTTRRRWSCSATTSPPTASRCCRRPAPPTRCASASYNQPDLMVLDLGLPDAGGLDVLREIREADGVAARFDPSLPVIVALRARRGARTGSAGSRAAPTTTSSSRSTTRSCARGSAPVLRRRRSGRREGPLPGRRARRSTRPRAQVRVGDRARRALQQGVRAAAGAGVRADPGLHQGGAAARRLGLSLAGAHPDARLPRQPAAAQARPRARAASSSTAGASATG